MAKLYPCIVCGDKVPVRSKGKCPKCRELERRANGEETMATKRHIIPKRSKRPSRSSKKRQKNRECLPLYFETLIAILKRNPTCQNCGHKINAGYLPHHNIAHILPKSTHPSVQCNLDNSLFLCAAKDNPPGEPCHHVFDNKGPEVRKAMPVYSLALKKFSKFKDKVLEKTKYLRIFVQNLEDA